MKNFFHTNRISSNKIDEYRENFIKNYYKSNVNIIDIINTVPKNIKTNNVKDLKLYRKKNKKNVILDIMNS